MIAETRTLPDPACRVPDPNPARSRVLTLFFSLIFRRASAIFAGSPDPAVRRVDRHLPDGDSRSLEMGVGTVWLIVIVFLLLTSLSHWTGGDKPTGSYHSPYNEEPYDPAFP
jgi:hypothetical protein